MFSQHMKKKNQTIVHNKTHPNYMFFLLVDQNMNFLFVCHTCVGHLEKSSVRLEKEEHFFNGH